MSGHSPPKRRRECCSHPRILPWCRGMRTCGDVSRLKTCWNYVGKEASKAGVILPMLFTESSPWSELSQSFAQGSCKFDGAAISPVSMVCFSTALMGLCHFQLKTGSSPSWEMPGRRELGFRNAVCLLPSHNSGPSNTRRYVLLSPVLFWILF